MAAKSKSEFRQLSVSLLKRKDFVALSPAAKTAFFLLRLDLPSYGLGQCVVDALHHYVGCSAEDLVAALSELQSAEFLDRDDATGILWLRGCEGAQNWGSPSFRTYFERTTHELPSSPVVERFKEELRSRHGIDTVVPQRESEIEGQSEREKKKEEENEADEDVEVETEVEGEVQTATSNRAFRGDALGGRDSESPPEDAVLHDLWRRRRMLNTA